MDYRVVLTKDAEEELEGFIQYLIFEKKSRQAASALLDDFEATKKNLSRTAGRHKLCDHPKLKELGYRRIHFQAHRYFMLYRTEEGTVVIDGIFHELQDYENRMT